MSTTLASSPAVGIDPEAIELLRAHLGGAVLLPGEAAYDQARRIWNGMIDKHPALIVQAAGAADVRLAVRVAREQGYRISMKGGGHNVAGYAVCDGGLMLDLSLMRGVWVDPVTRTARVQAGALWADVDRETEVFGLATTGGVISSTGVAGLTLGGGIGWLVGKHGMAIDNLLSVDLVTADGESITASVDRHPELFWALRGGGGNFGVATSFEFALHPQGNVLAGYVAYPIEQARDVLAFYRDFSATAPEELTTYAQLSLDPESGERLAIIAVCWPGDPEEGHRAVAALQDFGAPLASMIDLMSYRDWQRAFDAEFPHGRRYYWKGSLMRRLDDEMLDAVVQHGANPPLPDSMVAIEGYRGPMNRVDPAATAFPHRSAEYQVVIVAANDDPAGDQAGRAWARGLHTAIDRHALNGGFLNFNSLDDNERWDRVRAGFGDNWERLRSVKRRYDPTNCFRDNSNIPV